MRVLIVAAHPDDEVLGCGGTIARHAGAGDGVNVVFVADGVGSRAASSDELRDRQQAGVAAAAVLGADRPTFHLLPDNKLDTIPLLQVAQLIESEIAQFRPEVIYTHHAHDLNVDHRIVAEAVLIAARPVVSSSVRAVYGFEIVSSTEWAFGAATPFRPQRFVDVAAQLDRKFEALKCYAAEIRPFPHPRSLEGVQALARIRGATVGLEAAEAFVVYREIVGSAANY